MMSLALRLLTRMHLVRMLRCWPSGDTCWVSWDARIEATPERVDRLALCRYCSSML